MTRHLLARWTGAALQILVCLALALVVLPVSNVAWICEGKICGTTPWVCCCAADASGLSDGCGSQLLAHPPEESSQNSVKVPGCHCQKVTEDNASHARPTYITWVPPVFLVSEIRFVFACETPQPDSLPRPPDSRGPPLAAYCPQLPGRSPPVLV